MQSNPLLSIQNNHHCSGYLRYILVNNVLYHAYKSGRLNGFQCRWEETSSSASPESNSLKALVMEIEEFSFEPHHLRNPKAKPRRCIRRDDYCMQNQRLLSFEEPEKESKYHFVLVHGNKELEFLNLALIDDMEKKTLTYSYSSPSLLIGEIRSDVVDVEDFKPVLKDTVKQLRDLEEKA